MSQFYWVGSSDAHHQKKGHISNNNSSLLCLHFMSLNGEKERKLSKSPLICTEDERQCLVPTWKERLCYQKGLRRGSVMGWWRNSRTVEHGQVTSPSESWWENRTDKEKLMNGSQVDTNASIVLFKNTFAKQVQSTKAEALLRKFLSSNFRFVFFVSKRIVYITDNLFSHVAYMKLLKADCSRNLGHSVREKLLHICHLAFEKGVNFLQST